MGLYQAGSRLHPRWITCFRTIVVRRTRRPPFGQVRTNISKRSQMAARAIDEAGGTVPAGLTLNLARRRVATRSKPAASSDSVPLGPSSCGTRGEVERKLRPNTLRCRTRPLIPGAIQPVAVLQLLFGKVSPYSAPFSVRGIINYHCLQFQEPTAGQGTRSYGVDKSGY